MFLANIWLRPVDRANPFTVKIDTPGVYLVRLETRNTQSDHEHFAAIDLIVGEEGKP